LIKRIDAKRGIWLDGAWKLEDGIIQELQVDGDYRVKKFDTLSLAIPETPETFQKRVKKPEEMTYRQLKEYSETVKNEGYDNTEYLVEMGFKIAWPLISFVLTLLGIPIALELKAGSIPLAVSAGIGLSVLYMVALSISKALGLSGILPPFLAAWTANLLFTLVGIYLMMTVEQ
jgi:lipopolysaccharide export system permease protein